MKYIICKNGTYLVQDENGMSVSTNIDLAASWNNPDKANNVLKNINNNKIMKKYHFEVRRYDPVIPAVDEEMDITVDNKEELKNSDGTKIDKPVKVKRKIFSQEERAEVYRKTKGYCYLCGDFVDFNKFEIEHRVPISKGGTNDLSNLFCSCHVCNSIKRDIYPEDFMKRITKIFMYQMNQRHGKKMLWKMMNKKIGKMLGE